MTVIGAQKTIEEQVTSWPGVESRPHRFGGVEFVIGKRELGHLHGDHLADIPFPRRIHDELIAGGRVVHHHWLPDSGWSSRYIDDQGDVDDVVSLLRMNYDRATARKRAGA